MLSQRMLSTAMILAVARQLQRQHENSTGLRTKWECLSRYVVHCFSCALNHFKQQALVLDKLGLICSAFFLAGRSLVAPP